MILTCKARFAKDDDNTEDTEPKVGFKATVKKPKKSKEDYDWEDTDFIIGDNIVCWNRASNRKHTHIVGDYIDHVIDMPIETFRSIMIRITGLRVITKDNYKEV